MTRYYQHPHDPAVFVADTLDAGGLVTATRNVRADDVPPMALRPILAGAAVVTWPS